MDHIFFLMSWIFFFFIINFNQASKDKFNDDTHSIIRWYNKNYTIYNITNNNNIVGWVVVVLLGFVFFIYLLFFTSTHECGADTKHLVK